jgi:ABC-type branched-subunit amino acid transport system ATPase component
MIGGQGCGKNTTTNRIAKLTAPYSSRNITNISDITGQFNSLIENKVFAVCNELKSDKDNK